MLPYRTEESLDENEVNYMFWPLEPPDRPKTTNEAIYVLIMTNFIGLICHTSEFVSKESQTT